MKNIIAYIRVSTDNQAKDDKFGLDVQRNMIEKYAAEHDMNIMEWVEDKGKSGAKERPGFDDIVYGEVNNPPCEAVVVAKSDRVARKIELYYFYKMMLQKKDIKLISVSEDFDAMGEVAKTLEALLAIMAEVERENIYKRTSAGRNAKAARGGYSGGQAPMGYDIVDGKLVVNKEEAEVVKYIFKLKADGKSLPATVALLNKNGYKTRRGKPFVLSTVQSIRNNERTYRGEYRYGKDGEWVKGQHEPILTDDVPTNTPIQVNGKIQLANVGKDFKSNYHEVAEEDGYENYHEYNEEDGVINEEF